MDLQGFSQDCAAILRRQFERRGFIIFQPEPLRVYGSLDGDAVGFDLQIFLREFQVGTITFSYHYRRRDSLIIESGNAPVLARTIRTDKPKKHRMVIRVVGANDREVARKSSAFWRGVNRIPATPMLDSEGRSVGGRPKIRKWAAWAAKVFSEKYLPDHINDQAQYIHDI